MELEKNLKLLRDSKSELQATLDIENNKLSNLKEQIRDIIKHGQTNSFNFYNTLKDDEIDLGKFINIAENNKTYTKKSQYSMLKPKLVKINPVHFKRPHRNQRW